MLRYLVISISILALAACSSMPSGPKFQGVSVTPRPSESVLYVYRPNAYYGMAVTYSILLNDKKIADLGNDGYFPLAVEPGHYSIRPDTDGIDHPYEFDAESGETVFLRLKVNRKPALCFCTSLEFEQVDKSVAVGELAATRKETERVYGYSTRNTAHNNVVK